MTDLLFALVALHFLCDFPLQGDFLARGKNHRAPLPGVPWQACLFAHAFIQAGSVAALLPMPYAVTELCTHLTLDWAKSEGLLGSGRIGFIVDQCAHIALRALYAALYATLHTA